MFVAIGYKTFEFIVYRTSYHCGAPTLAIELAERDTGINALPAWQGAFHFNVEYRLSVCLMGSIKDIQIICGAKKPGLRNDLNTYLSSYSHYCRRLRK